MNNTNSQIKIMRSKYISEFRIYFENLGKSSVRAYLCVDDINKAYILKTKDYDRETMEYIKVDLGNAKLNFVSSDFLEEISKCSTNPYAGFITQELCFFITTKMTRLTGITPSDIFTYDEKEAFCIKYEAMAMTMKKYEERIEELECCEDLINLWTKLQFRRLYTIRDVVNKIGRKIVDEQRIYRLLRENGDLEDDYKARQHMVDRDYAVNNVNTHTRDKEKIITCVTLYTLKGINHIIRLINKEEKANEELAKRYKDIKGDENGSK
jgi:hypothetical protein